MSSQPTRPAVPALRSCPAVLLRAAAVLLVLLGVVAMHQLAGGAHRSPSGQHTSGHLAGSLAGSSVPAAAGPAARLPSPHAVPPPVAGAATRADDGALPGAQVAGAVGAVGDGTGGHEGAPSCLAVLTSLLIVGLPVLTQLRLTPPDRLATRRVDTGPPGRGPPRDLLAQLCVLRT